MFSFGYQKLSTGSTYLSSSVGVGWHAESFRISDYWASYWEGRVFEVLGRKAELSDMDIGPL
jgi:hypothetical protein